MLDVDRSKQFVDRYAHNVHMHVRAFNRSTVLNWMSFAQFNCILMYFTVAYSLHHRVDGVLVFSAASLSCPG